MAFTLKSSDIKDIRIANGLFERADIEWYNKFFRYGYINPQDHLSTTREYLFFTKPNLYILEDNESLVPGLSSNSYFIDCNKRYHDVILQLQASLSPKYPFANILSATVKSSFEIPEYSCVEIEGPATSYGDKITYRGDSLSSESDGYDFTLEFQDTKYLELYHFFKMYDKWENLKKMNVVAPRDEDIVNKRLTDQMCLYKIVVGEDFETIVFWAKAWGVYPKNVPRSVFSNMDIMSDTLKYSINFHAEWIDDMEPIILNEFNLLTAKYRSGLSKIPLYDVNKKRINGVMCKYPYVEYHKSKFNSPNKGSYKLLWR